MADLASPIISALAALAGAGVGGLATYRATVRGSGLARQAERERWTRECRDDAYRAFLTARNRYVEAQIAKGDAMQQWERTYRVEHPSPDKPSVRADAPPFDFEAHRAPVEDAWADLERQLANLSCSGHARHERQFAAG